MKKKPFIFFVLAPLLFQSCSIWNLSYNHANLSKNMTYSSVELQTSAYMKNVPLSCGFNVGYGTINSEVVFDWFFEDGVQLKGTFEDSGLTWGLTPVYYFSSSRLQPFIACNFNSLWISEKKEEDKTSISAAYLSLTPNVGLRFFLSPKFAINGNYGYQFGKTKFDGIDIPKKTSGFNTSLGITLTF
jgi:hypothetical protein